MNGLAEGIQQTGAGMLIVSMFALISLAGIGIAAYVFSSRRNRLLRFRSATKKGLILDLLLFAVGASCKYGFAVQDRRRASHFHESLSTDGGRYLAKYAYLGGDQVLLRVYRTADMTLVAERTYTEPDRVKLLWIGRALIYDTSGEGNDGIVNLPPTLVDRILARLP